MTPGLSMQDRAAVGIVVAYLLFVVGMLVLDARSSTSSAGRTVDREQVLDRLERGETVRVSRWHGHDLELSGSLIIDPAELDTETDEDTQ